MTNSRASLLFILGSSLAQLTPELCALHDARETTPPASNTHAAAASALLDSGTFVRVVEGYAILNTGVGAGNHTGGGTNTDGGYFTFVWDSSAALPEGVCSSIPTFGGFDLCPPSDTYPGGATKNLMMGPRDVVVFYGCTPPPVEYFGYDFIITARLTQPYPSYPGTNFQDALSFRDINTASSSASPSSFSSTLAPTPYDRPALLVHTLDQESASSVVKAYTTGHTTGSMETGNTLSSSAGAKKGDKGAPRSVRSVTRTMVDPASVTVHALDAHTVRPLNRSLQPSSSFPVPPPSSSSNSGSSGSGGGSGNGGQVDDNGWWRESSPDLLGVIQRVTLAQEGYEDAFNAFLNMTFPVRFYVAANDAESASPMSVPLRSRESSPSSLLTSTSSAKSKKEPSEEEARKGVVHEGDKKNKKSNKSHHHHPAATTESSIQPLLLPTEKDLLSGALEQLKEAVKARFKSTTTTAAATTTRSGQAASEAAVTAAAFTGAGMPNYTSADAYDNWDERLAAENNDTWVAATRDATYGIGSNVSLAMVLRNSSAGVLIGALHTGDAGETSSNVAAYFEVGVDVTNLANLLDPGKFVIFTIVKQAAWFNHRHLKGSALRYFNLDPDNSNFNSNHSRNDSDAEGSSSSSSVDPSLAARLFAVDFVPDSIGCGEDSPYHGPWCVVFDPKALNPKTRPGAPPPFMAPQIGERIYSGSATHTGPSVLETLPTQLLAFDLQGPCALQFEHVVCRSDGVIGVALPCDSSCDDSSCQFLVWNDDPLFGPALLDDLLQCQPRSEDDDDDDDDQDSSAVQFSCEGPALSIYIYDNCVDKACQAVARPADDGFCTFIGDIPGCEPDDPVQFLPCSASNTVATSTSTSDVSNSDSRTFAEFENNGNRRIAVAAAQARAAAAMAASKVEVALKRGT
jgi:hypothetical protein